MPPDIDVVIQPGAALLPFCINIWFDRQRLQSRFVQALKQIPTACAQMAGDLAVQLIEK